VTLNTAGAWTDETLTCMNDALEPLSVKVSAPDGAEGDWYVTDGHIWHVRMTGDSIVLPAIGHPPEVRLQFAGNIQRNAGGAAPDAAAEEGDGAEEGAEGAEAAGEGAAEVEEAAGGDEAAMEEEAAV